jgi:hypothetical protein
LIDKTIDLREDARSNDDFRELLYHKLEQVEVANIESLRGLEGCDPLDIEPANNVKHEQIRVNDDAASGILLYQCV